MDELRRWEQTADMLEHEAVEIEELADRVEMAYQRIESAITRIRRVGDSMQERRQELNPVRRGPLGPFGRG